MPLTETAPYGSTPVVVEVLERYRETGLGGRITSENVRDMGHGAEVARRAVLSLDMLGLIDEDGEPTEPLKAFKQATTDTYKQVLADVLVAEYAHVFTIVGDLSSATPVQVKDSFRRFNPDSLRPRMVALFLGLCRYVAILEESAKTAKPAKPAGAPTPRARPTARSRPTPEVKDRPEPDPPPAPRSVDPTVLSWIERMPLTTEPWAKEKKDAWFTALRAIADTIWAADSKV